MKKLKNFSENVIYSSAIFILILITVVLLFSSVMFLFKVEICPVSFMMSILISIFVYILVCEKTKLNAWIGGFFLAVIIFILSMYICTSMYDLSFDGNWYHKASIGSLANGWNPIYEKLNDFAEDSNIGVFCNRKFPKIAKFFPHPLWGFFTSTNNY